jgi:hypothetical protein
MLTAETLLALGITKPLPRLGRPPSRPNPRPVREAGKPDPDGRLPVELERLLMNDADVLKHRTLDCRHYTLCLDEAAPWQSWSCAMCQHHGSGSSAAELVTLASRRSGSTTP